MSKFTTHELDLAIQLSLVANIREAAQRYKAEPDESGSAELRSYLAALERLAEHIEAHCREVRLLRVTPLPATAKPRTGQRVIPFPTAHGTGGAPFSAA